MPARVEPAVPPYPEAIERDLLRLTPAGAEPFVLFRTLARDPRLFARFIGGGLLDRGHLTLRDREVVIHRICALNGAAYEWGIHAAVFARRAALDAAQLEATAHGDPSASCWSDREALLIRFCDAVNARADLDDSLWTPLAAVFGEMGVVELLLLAGFYRTASLLVNALRLPPEPIAVPFPQARSR